MLMEITVQTSVKKRYIKKRKYKVTSALVDYVERHPFCEACGQPGHGLPHHIQSTGAHGRIDEDWNLLRLCFDCHYGIVHGLPGIRGLIEQYPRIAGKVQGAMTRGAV